jgi:hypothetical protein
MVEGNIYEHVDTAQIARRYPPVEVPEVGQFRMSSYEVRELHVDADAGA